MSRNELDLSFATIISIYPRDIKEAKPGLFPSEYIIPAGSIEKPGLCIVSNDVHHLVDPNPLDESKEAKYIKVNVKAIEAAQSIINDWIVSLIEVEHDAMPGLFAVRGDYYENKVIVEKFSREIKVHAEAQYAWFANLVRSGDDIWAKSRSTQGISDIQRLAAQTLNLKREWLVNLTEPNKCPFCASNINVGAIKCITCGEVLNKVAYDHLKGTSQVNPLAVR